MLLSFSCYLALLCSSIYSFGIEYYSQFTQDQYLYENFFKDKRNGVFFEVGCLDGIKHSNSYFFEKHLGWTGVCVEPMFNEYKKMVKNRSCICFNGCLYNKTGNFNFIEATFPNGEGHGYSGLIAEIDKQRLAELKSFWIKSHGCTVKTIKVFCCLFNDLCEKHAIKHIDYLSIDTEGSELKIIQSIDFSKITIEIIGVEVNPDRLAIKKILEKNNYVYLEQIGSDDFYKKRTFKDERSLKFGDKVTIVYNPKYLTAK